MRIGSSGNLKSFFIPILTKKAISPGMRESFNENRLFGKPEELFYASFWRYPQSITGFHRLYYCYA